MSGNRDRHGNPMYGAVHKAERKRFVQRMKRGEVFFCWRPTCPRPNEPIDPRYWDLGHVDPDLRSRFGHRWPEHPSCDRATLPRMLAKARGEAADDVVHAGVLPAGVAAVAAHDCRMEFKPGVCAECRRRDPTPTDTADRWSRHWYGGFNPRCPECRERGAACVDAQRFAAEATA